MALTPGVALPAPLLTGRGEDDVRDGYQGHHGTCCEDSGGLIDDVGYGSAAQLSDDGGQIPSVGHGHYADREPCALLSKGHVVFPSCYFVTGPKLRDVRAPVLTQPAQPLTFRATHSLPGPGVTCARPTTPGIERNDKQNMHMGTGRS